MVSQWCLLFLVFYISRNIFSTRRLRPIDTLAVLFPVENVLSTSLTSFFDVPIGILTRQERLTTNYEKPAKAQTRRNRVLLFLI